LLAHRWHHRHHQVTIVTAQLCRPHERLALRELQAASFTRPLSVRCPYGPKFTGEGADRTEQPVGGLIATFEGDEATVLLYKPLNSRVLLPWRVVLGISFDVTCTGSALTTESAPSDSDLEDSTRESQSCDWGGVQRRGGLWRL
jgi:hypothetical protein